MRRYVKLIGQWSLLVADSVLGSCCAVKVSIISYEVAVELICIV